MVGPLRADLGAFRSFSLSSGSGPTDPLLLQTALEAAAEEVSVVPARDPRVRRTLLSMHLRLFEWFTSEWADLAPYVVGGPLLPLVRGLPAGVCIKDHFGARGNSHWPLVLSSLLDIRRDFDAAVSDYDREFDYFASCLGDLRAARADLCEFIAVFTIAPDVGGLAIRTGRLLYAYAMHASTL